MDTSLPEIFRPRGVRYKKLRLGLDVPSYFYDELKAIDRHLYLVWHPYVVMYEGIIQNDYEGDPENPRHKIHYSHGELCFGTVPLSGETGEPLPENRWHLWRLNPSHGWSHIAEIESTHPEYLNLLLKRLWVQDKVVTKYGHRTYREQQEEFREGQREKERDNRDDEMKEWHRSNKEFVDKAADNLSRKAVDPTFPVKETIVSSGQSYRSTLRRPLEDEDVLKPPGG